MIRIWKQQGKTILIAEHRLYYLKELIDRVLYLNDGRIEKDYTAQEALSLSTGQQISMGLRPFELAAFPSTPHPFDEKGQIQCENFHFAYTKHRDALNIDCLSLPEGGIVALIGHNGAGKSTLMNILGMVDSWDSGSYVLDGIDVKSLSDRSLAKMRNEKVGFVLQDFALIEDQTVLFNVSLPLLLGKKAGYGDVKPKAVSALEKVGLFDQKSKKVGQLSGGQKQRLCIARALLKKPKILILDDSTSAVDMATDEHIRRALKTAMPGSTKIIIAQRIASILSCDRIIVLHEGELSDVGTHAELMERSQIYRDVYDSQMREEGEQHGQS